MSEHEESPTSRLIHELKNPLMAIKGLAATGARLYEEMSDEERREFFVLLNEESDRLIKVMENSATTLRAEAGEIDYDVRDEPIAPIIDAALREVGAGRAVTVDLDENLSARCDGQSVRWIVAAALDNAVRYSPDDAPVSITGRTNDGRTVIEVVDEGPGLAEPDAAHAFDRCGGVRPAGYEDVPGAGLSLYLARLHMGEQNGSVGLRRDSTDTGTIFTLTLEASGMGGANRPVRLLICDDHRVLTDALAMVVEREEGLTMVAPPAHEPETAVAICEELHPDVVLMDVRFKGPTNGIEATRHIKEISPATKVVIMTAHEDDHLLVEAVEAGASGFLGKTEAVTQILGAAKAAAEGEVLIDPSTLTRLLRQVARERQAHKEARDKIEQLTDREIEVLQLLAQGSRNDEVAARLSIAPQTVQTHVRNILPKLGVHSKLEAVAFAVKSGVISI